MNKYYIEKIVPYADIVAIDEMHTTSDGYDIDLNKLDPYLENFAAHFLMRDAENGQSWYFLTEHDEDNALSSKFTKFMISGSEEDRYDFLDALMKAAIEYYRQEVYDLIIERVALYEASEYYRNGFVQVKDQINGEPRWVRA